MDLNAILEVIEDRLQEKRITKSYVAQLFDMSVTGVTHWFNDRVCIPSDKLLRLCDLVDVEIVIRDRNTHAVICGNLSESELKDEEEMKQLRELKKALSVLGNFLKGEG